MRSALILALGAQLQLSMDSLVKPGLIAAVAAVMGRNQIVVSSPLP
jgi:hypothetical protein